MLSSKKSLILVDEHSNKPIRLIIGCLVFVLTLVISGTLALNHFVEKFTSDLTSNIVFEVNLTGIEPLQQPQLLASLQQVINGFPSVKESFVVPVASSPIALHETAAPLAFIEAVIHEKPPLPLGEVLLKMQQIHPQVHIQSHAFMTANIRYLYEWLKLFSYGIIALISFVIIITISVITRSGFQMQKNVVDILRLIGAPSTYIAKQFHWIAFRLGFSSSFIGVFFGVAVFFMTAYFGTNFGLPKDLTLLNQNLIIAFVLLPFIVGFISLFVARFEVMRTLIKLDK